MKLLVQPDDGIESVLTAVHKATKSIEIVIFRLDLTVVVKALEAAIQRGVTVRALIAHTNKGGEKTLRKLETRLLDAGATVSRTADDLLRYHGKMMIIDERHLHLFGFNLTSLDLKRSRSFGVVTSSSRLVREAMKLFQADCDHQPYTASFDRLVVSPENSRDVLAKFIRGARRQLLIYDPELSDGRMLRLIADRAHAGVDVRILGKVAARSIVKAQKFPGHRLHVRTILRDGHQAFLGSQSLRPNELDRRREIGVIVQELPVIRKMVAVFESDWAETDAAAEAGDRPDGDGKDVGDSAA